MTGLHCLCRHFEYNDVEAEGAAILAPALQQLKGLTTLLLSTNGIRDDGMLALAPVLQQLTGLRTL